jgi:HAD superfamily hydrolase (TIGR01484 family)
MIVLTDIDDTLTTKGLLLPKTYEALWNLFCHGIQVIPVTGRPAGWCEMIARMWPVAGVVGENGAFYFAYQNNQMIRSFDKSVMDLETNKKKLKRIEKEILEKVPGAKVSSDQFCRMFDLAIDVCEDIPALSSGQVQLILDIFKKHGATAKLSSIHVNGWFGSFNKLEGSLRLLQDLFNLTPEVAAKEVYFIGDSPNDEPMWAYFQNSYAVANIRFFLNQLSNPPKHILNLEGGSGFVEFAKMLIKQKSYPH